MRILILVNLLLGFNIYGAEDSLHHKHGSHAECPLPKSIEDITSCAMKLHPRISIKLEDIEITEEMIERASQRPNPEINGNYLKGQDSIEGQTEIEAKILFTFELGGKQDARVALAKSKHNLTKAELGVLNSSVKVLTIEKLFRLRQIQHEISVLLKTKTALGQILKQLSKLPRLSASQKVTRTQVELALQKTRTEETLLTAEQHKIEHYFHISTGYNLEQIENFLPAKKKKWPIVSSKKMNSRSLNIQSLRIQKEFFVRGLELEESRGWSDLKVGPSVSIEKDEDLENKMIGIGIQMDLPIFHQNDGDRELAKRKLERVKKIEQLTILEENHERQEQLLIYQKSVKTIMSLKKINLNYLEGNYKRGIISNDDYLGIYDRFYDDVKLSHELEMTALKAFWKIQMIDGNVLKEKI